MPHVHTAIAMLIPACSGSGKTTLLDVLAGRKNRGKVEGSIKYGGHKPTTAFLRRSTGYGE